MLSTWGIASLGAVPTSVTIVEVVKVEGMAPLLKLAADSNSICGDIRRRRSAVLWLRSWDRNHGGCREDVVAPVVGLGFTTGRSDAGGIGYLKKEGKGKGGGKRCSEETDG